MLTKILLTLAVIIGCFFALSARRASPAVARQRPDPKSLQKQKVLRRAAWSFMLVMLVSAGIMISLDILQSSAVVTVHVVNTRTGERISYRARREDIQKSSFTTVEGRQVFTAGVERIEIEAPAD